MAVDRRYCRSGRRGNHSSDRDKKAQEVTRTIPSDIFLGEEESICCRGSSALGQLLL